MMKKLARWGAVDSLSRCMQGHVLQGGPSRPMWRERRRRQMRQGGMTPPGGFPGLGGGGGLPPGLSGFVKKK